MSTKSKNKKALYTKADVAIAKAENTRVRKYYSRKSERRKTVQVRVSEKWHKKLKELSHSEKLLMSFLLDEICKHFFDHYQL